MKKRIIEFKDLSESREVIEQKIPNFMLIFFYFILVLITSFLIWSYFGEKEIVVQSSGIVKTENIQTYVPLISGTVTAKYFEEGDTVSVGDLIIQLESTSLTIDISSYSKTRDEYLEDIILEELYLESVEQEENLFSLEIINQITKYYEFEDYLIILDVSLAKDKTKNEELVKVSNSIEQINNTISQYNGELEKLENQLESYNIYAEVSGVIHYSQSINIGSSIQAGYEVLRIYDTSLENNLTIEFYVLNSDITKISIGQFIRVEVSSLSSKEFGYATAEVIAIESDSRTDQQSGQSFYVVTARLNESSLSSNTDTHDIIIGMQVRGRMIVDTQSYLYWGIEKLELWIFE